MHLSNNTVSFAQWFIIVIICIYYSEVVVRHWGFIEFNNIKNTQKQYHVFIYVFEVLSTQRDLSRTQYIQSPKATGEINKT